MENAPEKQYISVRMLPDERVKSRAAHSYINNAVTAVAWFAGLFGILTEFLRVSEAGISMWQAWLAGVCTVCILLAAMQRTKRGIVTVICLCVAAAALLAAGFGSIQNGGVQMINRGVQTLSEKLGRIFLEYGGGSGIHSAFDETAVMVPVAVMLAAFSAVMTRFVPRLTAFAAVAIAALCLAGVVAFDIYAFILLLACASLLTRKRFDGNHMQNESAFTLNTAFIVLLDALMLAAVSATAKAGVLNLTEQREAVSRFIHEVRFESAEQPMPEGRLNELKPFEPDDTPMLNVTMSSPRAMYLRTYVGERYSGSGWEKLEASILSQYADSAYWLHKMGFYANTQLSGLAQLLGTEAESILITVEATGACRENYAEPYELAVNTYNNAYQIRDTTTRTGGAFGTGSYSYEILPEQVSGAYMLMFELDDRRDDPQLREYIDNEQSYRDFVYENYMSVTQETYEAISQFLLLPESEISTFEAKKAVRSCLDGAVSYDTAAVTVPDDADFVSNFLLTRKSGYSVHYATAAAMMLRFLGVPARFAEGYIITQSDFSSTEDGWTANLTAQSAHAWVEYYEDGVGWIPFEVTPPYIGLVEEPKWPEERGDPYSGSEINKTPVFAETEAEAVRQEGSSGQSGSNTTPETPEIDIEQQDVMPELPAELSWKRILIITAATLLLLIAACVVFIIIRRRRITGARKAEFDNPDTAAAVRKRFAYCMELMWSSGLERENRSLFAMQSEIEAWLEREAEVGELLRLNSEAMFSNHSIGNECRSVVNAFGDSVLSLFKKKLNPLQRMRMKWIKCLY